ncbi:hypothetical protein D3C76_1533060 [compost metagenome]
MRICILNGIPFSKWPTSVLMWGLLFNAPGQVGYLHKKNQRWMNTQMFLMKTARSRQDVLLMQTAAAIKIVGSSREQSGQLAVEQHRKTAFLL